MIDISKLRIGDKVHYQPSRGKLENGMIKEIREDKMDGVWVVYNCLGDWENYQNYTGCNTNLRDLRMGWKFGPEVRND